MYNARTVVPARRAISILHNLPICIEVGGPLPRSCPQAKSVHLPPAQQPTIPLLIAQMHCHEGKKSHRDRIDSWEARTPDLQWAQAEAC